jgi:hypothetical protein
MSIKQTKAITKLISDHSADQHTKATLSAGSILLTLWRHGETHNSGQFKVTRNGNVTKQGKDMHMITRVNPIDKSVFRPLTARGMAHFLTKNPTHATIALDDADILKHGLDILCVIKTAMDGDEINIASVLEPMIVQWNGTLTILTTIDLPHTLLNRAINRT